MIDDAVIGGDFRGGIKPTLSDALRWIGSRVDDTHGASIGRLEDIWVDPVQGEPRWLLVKEGRFGGRHTLVPFLNAAAGGGRVWIPYERQVVRTAPEVRPGSPLGADLERELTEHYRALAVAIPSGAVVPQTDEKPAEVPAEPGPAQAPRPDESAATRWPPPPEPAAPRAYEPAPHAPAAAPQSPPRPASGAYSDPPWESRPEPRHDPLPRTGYEQRSVPQPPAPPPEQSGGENFAEPGSRQIEIEVSGTIRISGDVRIVES